MRFADVMKEFADKVGIGPAVLDADGRIALLFDGGYEITFCPDAEDRSVLFYAELGEASRLDRDGCLRLLRASLLGAETGGAAFGVHEALGTVVLWKRHEDEFEDCAALERAVNAFLAQFISWKEKLASPEFAGEGNPPGDRPGPFLFVGIPV